MRLIIIFREKYKGTIISFLYLSYQPSASLDIISHLHHLGPLSSSIVFDIFSYCAISDISSWVSRHESIFFTRNVDAINSNRSFLFVTDVTIVLPVKSHQSYPAFWLSSRFHYRIVTKQFRPLVGHSSLILTDIPFHYFASHPHHDYFVSHQYDCVASLHVSLVFITAFCVLQYPFWPSSATIPRYSYWCQIATSESSR